MLIRHQDLPRTTRTGRDGIRRLYPRFIKDGGLSLPVGHVIGYLDAMTGRRHCELEPDAILSLIPDHRQARSMLTVLWHSYRYRHETVADLVGDAKAAELAESGLTTPAEVRAWLHHRLNLDGQRFVTSAERTAYLARAADELGLEGQSLDALLTVDAERNARLIRVGPRPDVADVVTRYNITLALSVLRNASTIQIENPGLPLHDACDLARAQGVHAFIEEKSLVLRGQRDAFGSWARHGSRLARVAFMVLANAGKRAQLTATIQIGDRTLLWEPDPATRALYLPAKRVCSLNHAAATERVIAAIDERRRRGDGFGGWQVRRAPMPVAADGALIAPNLLFARDGLQVPLLIMPAQASREEQAAIDAILETTPLLIYFPDVADELAPIDQFDIDELLAALDDQVNRWSSPVTPIGIVANELDAKGWVPEPRIEQLTAGGDHPSRWLHPLLMKRGARLVTGAGLFDGPVWAEWQSHLEQGPVDIGTVKLAVARLLGPGAPANAVTLALLDDGPFLFNSTDTQRAA